MPAVEQFKVSRRIQWNASRTAGSYETHFLTERSDLKRLSFAGASLCF